MKDEFAHLSPLAIFADFTYLGHGPVAEQQKKKIENKLMRGDSSNGFYIPFIDYDQELGWVFHTLLTPDGLKSEKPVSEKFRDAFRPAGNKEALEKEVYEFLQQDGQQPRRQVCLSCGRADIVTKSAVYELKDTLTRDKLFNAIGQVLIYRQEIDKALKAVVVGRPSTDHVSDIILLAAQLGVEVWQWKKK